VTRCGGHRLRLLRRRRGRVARANDVSYPQCATTLPGKRCLRRRVNDGRPGTTTRSLASEYGWRGRRRAAPVALYMNNGQPRHAELALGQSRDAPNRLQPLMSGISAARMTTAWNAAAEALGVGKLSDRYHHRPWWLDVEGQLLVLDSAVNSPTSRAQSITSASTAPRASVSTPRRISGHTVGRAFHVPTGSEASGVQLRPACAARRRRWRHYVRSPRQLDGRASSARVSNFRRRVQFMQLAAGDYRLASSEPLGLYVDATPAARLAT